MAADLITLAEGALLTQFLTPTAKHYGEIALKRIQQLGERAKAMLAGAGREPQGVDEKLLVPLVQAASLESEPTLAEKWAALLANAADPAQRVTVQPGFTEVLRQLTTVDARTLALIYKEQDSGDDSKRLKFEDILELTGWVDDSLRLSLDNLLRLRLIETPTSATYGPRLALSPGATLAHTTYGRAFLAAVTPPTA